MGSREPDVGWGGGLHDLWVWLQVHMSQWLRRRKRIDRRDRRTEEYDSVYIQGDGLVIVWGAIITDTCLIRENLCRRWFDLENRQNDADKPKLGGLLPLWEMVRLQADAVGAQTRDSSGVGVDVPGSQDSEDVYGDSNLWYVRPTTYANLDQPTISHSVS